ncbi:MAG: TIGR01777 family oxidoreductase [Oligoflexia bacterium]|nr:TIGR01777 family oxidoreductase [Oligoflexia bacterium]
MIVVITGGTGLVGQALIKKLIQAKHTVYNITRKLRNPKLAGYREFLWPECSDKFPMEAFPTKESYGVINLAGEPVSIWPWTKKRKEKIYSSRVNRSQQLVSAFKENPPQFFISASAIGIYGDQGDQTITEESDKPGQNLFLQKVCLDWEESALRATSISRTVIFRFGIVLSYKKGFLYEQSKWIKKGCLPFVFSFKEHWLSWISIEDLTSLILWAVQNENTRGVYNAVSSQPVSLRRFYFVLKKQYKSAWLPLIQIPAPLFLLKRAGGEMFQNLLMSSRVLPAKALSEGFVFKQKDLETALKQKNC